MHCILMLFVTLCFFFVRLNYPLLALLVDTRPLYAGTVTAKQETCSFQMKTVASLFLVERPGAPSSVLPPSTDALCS